VVEGSGLLSRPPRKGSIGSNPICSAKLTIRKLKMAKGTSGNSHARVVKRTSQGGSRPKTSSMTKVEKRSHKAYRGQGR
jgi:hypothetical protein